MLSWEKSTDTVLRIGQVVQENLRGPHDFEMIVSECRDLANWIHIEIFLLFVLSLELIDGFESMCHISQFEKCHYCSSVCIKPVSVNCQSLSLHQFFIDSSRTLIIRTSADCSHFNNS